MATIVGTSGNDNLTGGYGPDLIQGLAGNDSLGGGGGADRLEGGDGNDYLNGGLGDDTLVGGDGDDHLSESDGGNDRLLGGAGNDSISIIRNSPSTAHLTANGGVGADHFLLDLYGGGSIIADGGDGADLFQMSNGVLTLTGGTGQDTFQFDDFFELFSRDPVTITDFQTGNAGDNVELGRVLEQLTNWDGSANPFGDGHLRLMQSGSATLLQVDRDGGGNGYSTLITLQNATATQFTTFNFTGLPPDGTKLPGKTIVGTSGNDNLTGGYGPDLIQGLAGNDSLGGGGGADRLEGGDGNDYLNGGLGDDTLVGGDGDDHLSESDGGNDRLLGGAGNDSISIIRNSPSTAHLTANGGVGADHFLLDLYGGGSIIADGGDGADLFQMSNGVLTLTGGTGQDTFQFDDFFELFSRDPVTITDFQTGNAGDNVELGRVLEQLTNWDGSANPFGDGHLRLMQSGSATLLQVDRDGGGNGYSTLITLQNATATQFTTFNFTGLPPDGTKLPGKTIVGTSGNDNLTGGYGPDLIQGLAGNDSLGGGGGADRLEGGDGNDYLNGGLGDDTLVGGDGDDHLSESDGGNDRLLGGAGNDSISIIRNSPSTAHLTANGGVGADHFLLDLYGGGSIIADGGDGADLFQMSNGVLTLTGGTGQDTFQFDDFFELFSRDPVTITDFQTGNAGDNVELGRVLEQLTNWDGSANPFGDGHLRLMQSGSATLLQVDRDGGGNGYSTLITLQNATATQFTTFNFTGLPPNGGPMPHQAPEAVVSDWFPGAFEHVLSQQWDSGAQFLL